MQLVVGVLISIPNHMRLIYEKTAETDDRDLRELIADDLNKVCQIYFDGAIRLEER